jgi:DNA-binding GntR family transcriptional regulator
LTNESQVANIDAENGCFHILLQFLLMLVASWLQRQQAAMIDYLKAESRVLRERLGGRLDFYNVMFSVAGNGELDRALPLGRAQLFRTQFHQFLTVSDLRAISEYRGVADAILAGDEQKAEQRMRKHIQRTGERTIPRLSHFTVDPVARDGA